MARYRSSDVAFLLVDGLSVLGQTTEITEGKEAVFEDTTVLGTAGLWETWDPVGLSSYTLNQSGFFNDAAGSANEAFVDVDGATRVINFGVETNTKGARVKGFEGPIQSTYHRQAAKGELSKANATIVGSGAYEEGLILLELSAQSGATGDTESTEVDWGASGMPTTDGGTGFLQVTSLTLGGATAFVVKIRHSSSLPTFADLLSFDSQLTVGAQRQTCSGTVNRYLAISWAFTGGSGQGFTAMVGFHRN